MNEGKVVTRRGQDSSLQVVMGRGWKAWKLRHTDQDQEAFWGALLIMGSWLYHHIGLGEFGGGERQPLNLKLKRLDLIQGDIHSQVENPSKYLRRHARSCGLSRRISGTLLMPEGFQCRQIKGRKRDPFLIKAQSQAEGGLAARK